VGVFHASLFIICAGVGVFHASLFIISVCDKNPAAE